MQRKGEPGAGHVERERGRHRDERGGHARSLGKVRIDRPRQDVDEHRQEGLGGTSRRRGGFSRRAENMSVSKQGSIHRRFQYESLEARTMMAGDIAASVVKGSLILEGADLGESIAVAQ